MCLICGMVRNINANLDQVLDINNLDAFIDNYINNDVAENNLETNMEIVNQIFGSVFKAIKSYKNEYKEYPNDKNEEIFYMYLAHHAFYSNITIKNGKIVKA
jgi:hypothetical protein